MSETALPSHPAKFSDSVLSVIKPYVRSNWLILDPFAGVGKLGEIAENVVYNEIEPEWTMQCPVGRSVVGDALSLAFESASFDAVITSCTYGNRMADHHNAQDASKRISYTHTIGRKLHPNNSGQLQWGERYREFHRKAWRECWRVLKFDGILILNVSDHIRDGQVMEVAKWHYQTLLDMGFVKNMSFRVETPRLRRGANWEKRVSYEVIYIMKKMLVRG